MTTSIQCLLYLIEFFFLIEGLSLGATMYWEKDEPLLFHVVEKVTGNIFPVKYEADPMGFFHMINAYEEDGFILLDAPFKSSPVSYNVFKVKPLSGKVNGQSRDGQIFVSWKQIIFLFAL